MGRGGYDTTDAAAYKSSAAADVIREHNAQRARAEVCTHRLNSTWDSVLRVCVKAEAAEEMRRDELAKLIRSKKSRGIRVSEIVGFVWWLVKVYYVCGGF